jgi:hypothetical protein
MMDLMYLYKIEQRNLLQLLQMEKGEGLVGEMIGAM